MPLVHLQTNLKSLQFGKDRPGGGSSGQPYETVPIPGNNDPIDPNSEDFLLRGGLNGPRDSFTDVKRLTKFFNDRLSPDGLNFIAKQTLLSRIGVRTQASGVGLNEGAYTPLSTLAQVGISLEGGHIPKQGLVPFRGPNTYLDQAVPSLLRRNTIIGEAQGEGNRLVELAQIKGTTIEEPTEWKRKNKTTNQIARNNNNILSYGGGPNSLIGVGNTIIPFAKTPQGTFLRTGRENIQLQKSGFFNTPKAPINTSATLSGQNGNIVQVPTRPVVNTPPTLGGFDVFTVENQRKFSTVGGKSNSIQDFREETYKIRNQKISYVTGIAPAYNNPEKTIDGEKTSRINYVSPGQKGNVIDYTAGKLDPVTGKKIGPVDRINALPIYRTSNNGLPNSIAENDLVKFRIGAIDNNNPEEKDYINFRAFIDSFSDTYNATWNPQKYMGRGEPLYNYSDFRRDVNISFTVAAQSREEIMIMYRKLNYLISNLAPDYTGAGYMAGPLVTLTLGGWCYELPGFINSITLDVPQESPWEIGIPSVEKEAQDVGGITFRDPNVKEMPMICKVTGFSFTPIHRFRPAKQTLNHKGEGVGANGSGAISPEKAITLQDTNIYGPERYISLANGEGESLNNYDNK